MADNFDWLRKRAKESEDADFVAKVNELQSQFMDARGVMMELQQTNSDLNTAVTELINEVSKLRELGDLEYKGDI